MPTCEFYNEGECKYNLDGICEKYTSKVDGLSLHCSGFWSQRKINYFKGYTDMISTGMKYGWPTRCYIDLFSGPGKCIIRENLQEIDGASLEAIHLKGKFTKYFLVDRNSICIENLKKRIGKVDNVEYYNNDCNLAIKEIVKKIPKSSLNLAIIDPDSHQFEFNSYTELAKKRIDLIVNYPVGPFNRAVSKVLAAGENSKKLDNFHPEWQKIVANKNATRARWDLIKDYISKIENLGYISNPSLVPFKILKIQIFII